MRKVHKNLYTHKNNTSSCRFIWCDRWPFIHSFVLSNFLVSSLLLFYCDYLWSFKIFFWLWRKTELDRRSFSGKLAAADTIAATYCCLFFCAAFFLNLSVRRNFIFAFPFLSHFFVIVVVVCFRVGVLCIQVIVSTFFLILLLFFVLFLKEKKARRNKWITVQMKFCAKGSFALKDLNLSAVLCLLWKVMWHEQPHTIVFLPFLVLCLLFFFDT